MVVEPNPLRDSRLRFSKDLMSYKFGFVIGIDLVGYWFVRLIVIGTNIGLQRIGLNLCKDGKKIFAFLLVVKC